MSTIAVIDDDQGILSAIQAALALKGYTVITVTDSMRAAEIVAEHAPDLIFPDYLLSGQDGLQVLAQIKANKSTQHIPVVMMSAHPDAYSILEKEPIARFMSKPFDLPQLWKISEQILQGTSA